MTLVELMVAVAVTSIIMALSTLIFVSQYKSYRTSHAVKTTETVIQKAVELVRDDIALSGWSVKPQMAFYFVDGGNSSDRPNRNIDRGLNRVGYEGGDRVDRPNRDVDHRGERARINTGSYKDRPDRFIMRQDNRMRHEPGLRRNASLRSGSVREHVRLENGRSNRLERDGARNRAGF